MNFKKLFFIAIIGLCIQTAIAQDLTAEQKERLEHRVDVFLSDNEEIQALWFEDLMDRMKLRSDSREDYHNIVKYHAFKMKLMDDPTTTLSKKQIKTKIQKQVKLMNEDVKDVLDSKQLEIHRTGWSAIEKAVLKKLNDN